MLELYVARKNNRVDVLEESWTPIKTVFPDFDYI